jgi:Spy/CpxP family protein refolding chaperone
MQAGDATVFDEATVRTIAAEQAKIEIELIVSRTRVQSLINALLTAEQLELLKNLRPDGR